MYEYELNTTFISFIMFQKSWIDDGDKWNTQINKLSIIINSPKINFQ